MVNIRNINEIISSLIDFYKIAQPNLDTKPGTVARDLLIDGVSNQLALVYDELNKSSSQQSLRFVVGSDLDKYAKNYGIPRFTFTPSSGLALITFSSLPATVSIKAGDLVVAQNGTAFKVLNGQAISPSLANFYKSIATKYQNDLTFVGITDPYAVEVTVQATTPGIQGNISKYTLSRTNIAGASNVTNVQAFSGGNDTEDDASFRNRILNTFSGSSVGTSLGYKNVALATTGVQDAFVVEPGDPLMTRDGTVTTTDSQGNITIVSEGTGGKVDIVILGTDLATGTDSFIYRDLSNNNDPSDIKNAFVLGQIAADAGKTINRKRIDDIKNGTVPAQPVQSITQVTGTGSGANFKPKSVDSLGRVTGNYELVKDESPYKGTPFGFDTFRFISDRITYNEDRIKGQFNGQDAVTFTDVLEISTVQQNVSITNENSTVLTSDRTLIQLLHTPASTVTRVFNVNTGERYTVVNQNPNGTGTNNSSGIIKISGNTLPSQSDVLQVDYNWIVTFDQYHDFDGKKLTQNLRTSTDSIDWGFSNEIKSEIVEFVKNGSGTFLLGSTSLPISSIIAVSSFTQVDATVTTITSGPFTNRLLVTIPNLLVQTDTIDMINWKNTNSELYNTSQADGTFTSTPVVVGVNLLYTTAIILPSDTRAKTGDRVSVSMNATDLFNVTGSTGSFNANNVTIPATNIATGATSILFKVSYIANAQNIISTGITSLPFSRVGNGFVLNNNGGFNNSYVTNLVKKENQTVQLNLSSQLYLEINLSSLDSTIDAMEVISIIRLSDGVELWNQDNVGTIAINTTTNNYQLILSGYHTPVVGDTTLIIYQANDIARFQPYTFTNTVFSKEFNTLQYDNVSNKFLINVHEFISGVTVQFQILETNTDLVLASGSDGALLANANPASALLSSVAVNFNTLVNASLEPLDVTSKRIRILNNANSNNNGVYDITGYNSISNTLTLSNNIAKINANQISVIRVFDGKELWSNAGVVDIPNNQLLIPASPAASPLDKVITLYSTVHNVRQSPTRLSLNLTDQVINTGVLSVVGTTVTKAQDIVFTSSTANVKQNLLAAVKKAMSLNSNVTVPSNTKLVSIAKLERVTTTNSASDEVILTKATYDLVGTTIQDNSFAGENFVNDITLGAYDFVLPSTSKNILNLSEQLSTGDKFRVTFYYSTTNDQENVIFTRNGTLYTNKVFGLIDKVYISSGFGVSQSAKLVIGNFNQPISGARYKAFYDYLAPKPNERIVITTNYNKLISNVTFNVERSRPINADVLVRQAESILVDVTMNIVVATAYLASSNLVKQNVTDKIISTINANGLGTTLEASSLVTAAFSVDGVAGARIINFNKDQSVGQVLRLKAQEDQYFVADTVTINQETV